MPRRRSAASTDQGREGLGTEADAAGGWSLAPQPRSLGLVSVSVLCKVALSIGVYSMCTDTRLLHVQRWIYYTCAVVVDGIQLDALRTRVTSCVDGKERKKKSRDSHDLNIHASLLLGTQQHDAPCACKSASASSDWSRRLLNRVTYRRMSRSKPANDC